MNSNVAVVFTVVALSFISTAAGLQCYVCSTKDHTACEDKLDPKRAEAAGFITDCPEATEKGTRTLCRTTHQTVLDEVRVIRSCGFANDTKECSGSRNSEVIINSCQCFTDLCNGGGLARLAVPLLLLAAALRALLL